VPTSFGVFGDFFVRCPILKKQAKWQTNFHIRLVRSVIAGRHFGAQPAPEGAFPRSSSPAYERKRSRQHRPLTSWSPRRNYSPEPLLARYFTHDAKQYFTHHALTRQDNAYLIGEEP